MTQLIQPVFNLHYVGLNLKKGVTEADFEAFMRQHGVHIPAYLGWKWALLKGLRGKRKEQYLILYEAEDQQTWNRYMDSKGAPTAAASAGASLDQLVAQFCHFWRAAGSLLHFSPAVGKSAQLIG